MAIGKLIYDSAMNRVPAKYSDVSKEERENKIRKEIFDTLGLELTEKFDKKAFRKAFRENKNKVYAIIEEVADQVLSNGDFQQNSFFNQFVELKNLALGDENRFYVEGLAEAEVVEYSGSHFNIKRRRFQSGAHFELEMKNYGVRVYQYFELVMAGREDFAKFVEKITAAIDKKLAEISQSALTAAITTLPTEFKFNGSYDEADILKVLQHVQASNGVKPIIVGTASALAKLQGTVIANGSTNMKDEKNSKGYMTLWNGYECLELNQGHKAGTFEFTMEENRLFALCGDDKIVKMVLEGESIVREINDGTTNADSTMDYTLTFKGNAAVCYSKMIGILDITG